MRTNGMVRQIDPAGRLVLPTALRRSMKINLGDPLEILVDGNALILRKYTPGCYICGSMGDYKIIKGKKICKDCLKGIRYKVIICGRQRYLFSDEGRWWVEIKK